MISVLDEILKEARNAGAGNVHIQVDCPPVMRVGKELAVLKFPAFSSSDTLDILLEVMNEAQRDAFEEKGESEVSYTDGTGGRCRVCAYRQNGNVSLSIRILQSPVPTLLELGADEQIADLCAQSRGLVIVTGESGSGKSTTIAAMTEAVNETRNAWILTLEAPVEYMFERKKSIISQRQIGIDSGSMTDALRAAMREDADVVVCAGRMDADAVDAMLSLVEAGHLVIAELTAADIAGAIDKVTLLSPAADRALLKTRLSRIPFAVISQRLACISGNIRTQYQVLKNKLWAQSQGESGNV